MVSKAVATKTKTVTTPVDKVSKLDAEESLAALQRDVFRRRMDQMEKKFSLTSQELHVPNRLSSGLLCYDLIGGSIAAGKMFQVSGLEKGAKTTYLFHCEGQAVRKDIPMIGHFDAENAVSDVDYVKACTGYHPSELYFGRDKNIRLYPESGLEMFYNSSKSLMRSVPDKFYRQEDKQWFHVFDADQDGRAMMGDFGYTKYNKGIFQDTGRLWCECPTPGMQGLILCDSYPALILGKIDDDDDAKLNPAMNAKAFAENIRKVIGVMARKGFAIVGINQIRVNPMPAYGQNPEYEPGGNALAFYSSVRFQHRPRGVPAEMFEGVSAKGNKTKSFGQEPSVYGRGLDRYNYIDITNTKNRLGNPLMFASMRVWFRDGNGLAHGFDLAYDTYQYLNMTGRIDGSPKRGIKIDLPEFKNIPKMDWNEFKLMILAPTDPILMKRAREQFENVKTIPNIRPGLFKEIRTKAAYKMLTEGNTKNQEDLEAA